MRALTSLVLLLVACVSQTPSEADRSVVLRAEQLAPYGVALPENFASYETLKREKWFDGSVMIEYEFDPPPELGLPYLYSSAERHPSSADACMSFHAGNFGTRLAGAELVERDDVFQFGAKSRFALLVENGEPLGNLFAMCDGKNAFLLMIGGVYFDERESWEELVGPTLRALESMR